jgi:DNA-binding transcriptional LysR family regulator
LREFEAFRALIAAGTATAAARRLGVSQSAVSRAVANLEARLGALLFERAGGRLAPTAEALAFDRSLDPLFEALTRIDRSRPSFKANEPLRIVAPATFAHRFLPKRIVSFLRVHADLPVSLEIVSSDVLVSGIAEGRHDLGLTDLEVNHSGVRTEAFRLSCAVCCVPAKHALANRETIAPHDLAGVPFVAATRRHSIRTTLDRLMIEAGVEPAVVVEAATSLAIWEFVRAGVGVAVLNPFPVALEPGDGVVIKPFAPRVTYRTNFLTPAGRPVGASARAFAKHVRLTTPRDAYSSPA